MSFLDSCRALVAVDSTPSNGNKEAAQHLAELCISFDLCIDMQSEIFNGTEQINLVARPRQDLNDFLMLQSHLDTPDPGPYQLWDKTRSNPFSATIYKDQLYGLGVSGGKLDFLCKLEALRRVVSSNRTLKKLPVLVGTYGEEDGMRGALKLLRKKKVDPVYALIGEPTALRLATSGLGMLIVEITIPFSEEERAYRREHDLAESSSTQSKVFAGKAAHSSAPSLGDNAIIKMFDYLAQLPEGIAIMDMDGGTSYNVVPSTAVLEMDVVGALKNTVGHRIGAILKTVRGVEQEFSKYPDPTFDPAFASLNIGSVRTDEDGVKVMGSGRWPPSVSSEISEEWVTRIRTSCEQVGATFRLMSYRPPFSLKSSSSLLETCQKLCSEQELNPEPINTATTTEASVFGQMGIECLVFGPGQGVGNSHAPNESIRISQLNKATDFYQSVIESFCL